ncbi:hypothetical protein CHLNCDRAFT_143584 [Chlorella variabilis]|uniref:Uncharacterized protein n=1 Tax=Chlorella variabilis TaxID=554065 RepID=E1ZA16_CHLVA|nr:hypothetical protein CHLNCDRAFT_143584 [Chlorella variabilis]EFN56982.1 hypothetical protein CHLNCDRAFT_143584 [Chlorella variabilis]|eukprot:XP_005849084.1 hypothetical protein CHLNCDRAFT_143584 [Chlorella variabilis]
MPEPARGRGAVALEIDESEEFEDITVLLEAEQRQLQHSWWARLKSRLPAWMRPGGQQQYRFHRLVEEEEGPDIDAAAAPGDGSSKAAGSWRRPAGRWCPEEAAGLLSRLSFAYVGGLIHLGYRKTLNQQDLWDVAPCDAAHPVADSFLWHLSAAEGVVWRAMWRAHGRKFIIAGVVKLAHDCVMFLGPFLLEVLLKHLQAGGSAWVGLGLASALAGASVVETITVNLYFHQLFRICLHLKIALVDMLYRKSLRISAAAKGELGAGKIVNLQSNDAAKLWAIPQYLHMIWCVGLGSRLCLYLHLHSDRCRSLLACVGCLGVVADLQILVVMGLLVRVIHLLPALAGLGVCVALIPLSALVGRQLGAIRRRLVAHTDSRVKLCTEIITGIKAIKLYAWEQPYVERITALREQELREIRKANLLSTVNNLVFGGGPILISLAAFMTYSALGYPLTAAVAFPALSLFNLLRFPVMMFPQQATQIMNLINGKVALDRIQTFMRADEMQQAAPQPPGLAGQPVIEVVRGSFSWKRDAEPLLRDISLAVPHGALVIVVGSVGSGKSSLLAALLGEMVVAVGGTVMVRGTVAYTQQDPWIQNATVRDNILMGAPLEESRYRHVLEACALRPDLEMLAAGDETEIGEKGVNLSGGQRHRVALARACYASADVYLLDDPLSAVDAHVGRHLFDRCICGLLVQATRVLVTHQLQYLPAADRVLVLRDGRLAEQGSYQELVARGVDFHQFQHSAEGEGEGAADGEGDSAEEHEVRRANGSSAPAVLREGSTRDSAIELQVREQQAEQGAEASAAAEASASLCGAVESGAVFTDVPLLDAPADAGSSAGPGSAPAGGPAEGSSQLEGETGQDGTVAVHSPNGSSQFKYVPKPVPVMAPTRKDLIAPPQPPGRPATPASGKLTKAEERAVGRVDRAVSWSPFFLIPIVVLTLGITERGLQAGQNWWLSVWSEATAAAAAADPPQGLNTTFYMMLYFGLGFSSLAFQIVKAVMLVLGSVSAARVLQERLLSCVVRLPMGFFDSQPTGRLLNRFTKDTGVSSTRYIRSSREIKRLDSLALSPIFGHFGETLQGLATVRAFRQQEAFEARNSRLMDESNRAYWPAQCINRWLSVRLELLGISVVFGAAVLVAVAAPRNAGLAGLALTSALNLTGLMNWMVRQTTELEVNMNSVERMIEYTAVEPEAAAIVEARRPLPGWPHQGAIEVEQLVVRYRPELDPVLRGVTFSVRGREKVGVAGRTGCGKSTLMLALFRIGSRRRAHRVIDSVDTSSIGLFDLRSRLALVPQDPVVFSGSIRSNLDPFGDAGGDDRIWGALAQAGLADAVRALRGGLDAPVAEGGGNLSVGQRQLLCMARALLRAARVLVLDEATSNVDTATDALIQATIATAFADCTVLTIAHRLHTIMDSDRVLVLHEGQVREYDTPNNLLAQPDSAFRGMVEETARHSTRQGSGGLAPTHSAQALAEAVKGRLPPPRPEGKTD